MMIRSLNAPYNNLCKLIGKKICPLNKNFNMEYPYYNNGIIYGTYCKILHFHLEHNSDGMVIVIDNYEELTNNHEIGIVNGLLQSFFPEIEIFIKGVKGAYKGYEDHVDAIYYIATDNEEIQYRKELFWRKNCFRKNVIDTLRTSETIVDNEKLEAIQSLVKSRENHLFEETSNSITFTHNLQTVTLYSIPNMGIFVVTRDPEKITTLLEEMCFSIPVRTSFEEIQNEVLFSHFDYQKMLDYILQLDYNSILFYKEGLQFMMEPFQYKRYQELIQKKDNNAYRDEVDHLYVFDQNNAEIVLRNIEKNVSRKKVN